MADAVLAAGSAEDFLLELAEAGFVTTVFQFRFDRVHLLLHAGDVAFEFDLQIGDVILRRHVLHDVRNARGEVADLLPVRAEDFHNVIQSGFLGHAGIVRGKGIAQISDATSYQAAGP